VTTSETHKKQKSKTSYLFNPYEIAICGTYSFYKNNFAQFLREQISEDGYDVSDAVLPKKVNDFVLEKTFFLNNDFVISDSNDNPNIPKILFINPNETFEYLNESEYINVIAYVGAKEKPAGLTEGLPFFHSDEIDKIKNFVLEHFKLNVKKIPLNGLILTGGKSSRMKTDKSMLEYHGRPQTLLLTDLLEPFCDKVFLSTAPGQNLFTGENFQIIQDKFLDIGPLGGIISAMDKYTEAAWLVLACDLPYIDAGTISYLIENRDPFKIATAYKSSNDQFPEPLCTIFEPKSRFRLFQFLGLGYDCPRKVLINSKVKLLEQPDKLSLTNVNYPEEYQSALEYFREKETK
jgi:molybdopterin-guanine dinucleotide biosynthesis protein A